MKWETGQNINTSQPGEFWAQNSPNLWDLQFDQVDNFAETKTQIFLNPWTVVMLIAMIYMRMRLSYI